MNELNEHYINIFDDRAQKEKYLSTVKDILERSYSDIGGPKNIESYEQLLSDRYFWKLVRKNGRIVCCAIYKTEGSAEGRKLSLIGQDGSDEGKKALIELLKEDTRETDRHMFGEFSGAVEHILIKYFNMPKIPVDEAERILKKLGKTIIRKEDDGFHYFRNVKGNELRKIMLGYPPKSLKEAILLEKTRQELINKSKAGDNYKGDQSKGRNRWERRTKSRIDTSVRQYNRINMNELFKNDTLDIVIDVHGETDDYEVRIKFSGVVNEIQREIKANNNRLEFKCVFKALARLYNTEDVSFHCSCPDWTYRQDFWSSKGDYNAGPQQTSNGKWIANPNDTKGGGCKHVNLVQGNADWIMKVSSVINNYIHYMEQNMQRQYADLMFPKLYGMPYDRAVQLNLFDTGDDLDSEGSTIDTSNELGRVRGRFRKDFPVNNQKNFGGSQLLRRDQGKTPGQQQLNLSGTDSDEEESQTL